MMKSSICWKNPAVCGRDSIEKHFGTQLPCVMAAADFAGQDCERLPEMAS